MSHYINKYLVYVKNKETELSNKVNLLKNIKKNMFFRRYTLKTKKKPNVLVFLWAVVPTK